jgi:phosphatidate cytidylyltransferase
MWSALELAGLLLLVGLGGQVGDLVESAIKRDLGVKDAPVLIPGHGGMLDRFDSYFFAFPIAYIYTVALRG